VTHDLEPDASADPIAIVGMAARVPGAGDLRQFWRNLVDGVESIRPATREELLARGADPATLDDPSWVNATTVVDGFDEFDAELFGMTSREAEITDPQHRVFLEACHSALTDGGKTRLRSAHCDGVYRSGGFHAERQAASRDGGIIARPPTRQGFRLPARR